MRYILTLFLILNVITFTFAKEYKFTKQCNPEILVKELEQAGIDLLGDDQIGFLATFEDTNIIITIKEGQVIDETVLNQIINNHIYKIKVELEQEKKIKKDKAEMNIKTKLGLTDKEFQDLKDCLKN